MPQASDEQRNLMDKWFGDPVSDDGPYELLMMKGFTDTGGLLKSPVSAYTLSDIDWECVKFLIDEWDYAYAKH